MSSYPVKTLFVAINSFCLMLATGAQAGVITKAATGTDLTAGASWGGTAPSAGDTATWNSASLGAGLSLGTASAWGGVSITGALTDIGITGAGTLTAGAGGIDMSASSVNAVINNPILLGASQTWSVNSGKTFTAAGVISGAATTNLTVTGGGTVNLMGANTYGGSTTVSGGTLACAFNAYVVPVAVSAESYYSPDNRSQTNAISGTGMTPNSPVVSSSTCGIGPGGNMWLSNGKVQTWITFDLGSVQTIAGFHLWNYNENYSPSGSYTNRGIKTCGIYSGNSLLANGTAYASAGAAWGTLVQNFTFSPANGSASYTGSDYSFTTPVTTRYLQIYVTTNYGFDAYTGISEIRFATAGSSGILAASVLPTNTAVNLSASGAALNLGTTTNTVGSLAGVAGTYVTNNSMFTAGGDNSSQTFAGAIIGSGFLTKAGSGALTLSGANSYTGTTTVNAGTLKAGSGSAFAGTGALALAGTSVFDLNGNNANFTALSSSVSTATVTDNSAGAGTSILILTNNGANTISATISDGPAKQVAVYLANNDSGTKSFTLTQPNTFSGGVTLLGGNALTGATGTRFRIDSAVTTVGNPGAIVSSPFGKGAITVGQAATDKAQIHMTGIAGIALANDIVVNTSLGSDVTGTFRFGLSNYLLLGTITANLAPVSFYSGGGLASGGILAGRVTGPSGLTLVSGGNMTITLSNVTANANDYAGDTTISAAGDNLILAATNQIPNGAGKGNVVNNGLMSLNGFSETINGLSGSGTVDGVSGTPTFSLGDNNATTSFGGIIKNTAGTLALTKIGTGTQTLTGANTFTGNTTISAGTLALGTGGSLSSSSRVIIGAGATFDVSALTTASAYSWNTVSLTASGTGNTIGSTAAEIKGGTAGVSMVSHPITLNYTPASFVTADSTHPALSVSSGALNLGTSSVTVSNNAGSPLDAGDYTIISAAGGTVSGTPILNLAAGVGSGTGLVSGKVAQLQIDGSGNLILHVAALPSTTTTIALASPWTATSTYGDALVFQIGVSGAGNPNGGAVIVKDGSTTIGFGTLSGGTATIALSSLNVLKAGSHSNITATYAGDSGNASSTSANLATQTVQPLALTASGAVASSKMYDGTTATTITGGTLTGVVSGDSGLVSVSSTGTFASVGPGSGLAVSLILSGAAAANYTVSQAGLTADILTTAIWTSTGTPKLWSDSANWQGGVVGTGSGNTADFNQVDITADTTVNLSQPRTIGSLIFGDTDPSGTAASWILANNGTAANNLTLAGATPTITVNPLGVGKTVTIGAVISGSSGLIKAGAGKLILTNLNDFSGGTTVSNGTLALANGGVTGVVRGALTINSNATVSLTAIDALGYGGNCVSVANINGGTLDNATSGNEGYNCSFNLNGGTMSSSGGGSYNLAGQTVASLSNSVASLVNAPLTIRGTPLTLNTTSGAVPSGIDLIVAGAIIQSGGTYSLSKTGPGAVLLGGTNTYAGSTTVSAGELIGSTTGSCASSAFTISSGATNGVQLAASGGHWTCNGLTYSSGTTYADFNFNSFAPSTTVAPMSVGALTVNGAVTILLRNVVIPAGVGNYPLIHYTGVDPSVSSFSLGAAVPLVTNAVGGLVVDSVNKNVSIGVQLLVPNLNYTNAPGIARRITIADILTAGLISSQGTPTYSITSVSANTEQGGTVINDSGNILYTPPAGSLTSDSFSYTVSDGTVAATATAKINFVSVAGPSLTPTTDEANHPVIIFHGIPGFSYHIQRATTLLPTPDWTNVQAVTISTSGNGSATWTDSSVDSTQSTVFYRVSYP